MFCSQSKVGLAGRAREDRQRQTADSASLRQNGMDSTDVSGLRWPWAMRYRAGGTPRNPRSAHIGGTAERSTRHRPTGWPGPRSRPSGLCPPGHGLLRDLHRGEGGGVQAWGGNEDARGAAGWPTAAGSRGHRDGRSICNAMPTLCDYVHCRRAWLPPPAAATAGAWAVSASPEERPRMRRLTHGAAYTRTQPGIRAQRRTASPRPQSGGAGSSRAARARRDLLHGTPMTSQARRATRR